MKMKSGMAAVAAVGMLAGAAQATDTLQLDVNGMTIQVRDAGGSTSAFGGLTHTGSIDFGIATTAPVTSMIIFKELGLGSGFTFEGSQAISGVDGTLFLTGGLVTGGDIEFTLSNGDVYSAQIRAGSGSVGTATTPGGFKIDGLTFDGDFTDPQGDGEYGTVDVAQWIAGEPLFGSFLEFNFSPDPSGFGRSDVDVFVLVPLPPAAYAGLGMLAGVMGLSYALRRR